MLKILGPLLLTTLISTTAFASAKASTSTKTSTDAKASATTKSTKSDDCKEVAADLKSMQKAQQSISESLISNHDTFATLLEDYSSALNISAGMVKPVTPETVTKMGESARSFRERGQNATKLNKKLTTASNDVIARAVACLTK